jgi:uncharacterized damage-inducible protein DinB
MDIENYLSSVKQQSLYYKSLGEKAMAQLEPGQLFIQTNEECNSIAMIVQHMTGNMLSRWTNFLTSDGEKEWRNRDEEFEPRLADREEVMSEWNAGWNCFLNAIDQLKPSELTQIIFIRSEPHTVAEAINRQFAHYPYHVGQIVLIAKQLKGKEFVSLSIPKNKSADYNREKFTRRK